SGRKIVIEEFLEGEEVSVLAFCDGRTAIPMVPAQDYKKAMDYDKGLNTGGMGSFSPCKVYTKEIEEFCFERILKPTINAMRTEGRPFQGILFLGLILTQKGPKVIEYNARFGDPETQSVMLRLKTDLLEILLACQEGTLDKIKIQWEDNAAVCVVMASGGYPENYEKGFEIKGLNFYKSSQDIIIFHAGTKEKGTNILTNGGRVLSVCARGKTIEEARNKAYEAAETISFDGAFYRKDIALKGI
ncbi:MAG: phosphoribosylamine--glycine ligase, partial [Lachnospiraceae bacterium]|nr:phosphoribosylamine--glycine ligase [Lachnospiraceae bacterium]